MSAFPKIAIVGIGMVGAAVRSASWAARYDVVTASRKSSGAAVRLDITDPASVEKFFNQNGPFAAVINCAAEANVDACEEHPEAARRVNALGVRRLAEGCSKTGAAFIHISTDYVFDGLGSRLYREEDPTGPRSVYGITKLEGEHYALTIPEVSAVIRSTWIFGGVRMDFVNGVIDRIRRGEKPAVVDNQTASPSYASDLGDAIGRVIERFALPARAAKNRSNRVFHISNKGHATRHAMAARIARALGVPADLPRASASDIPGWVAVRPRHTALDTDRARRELGIDPGPWEAALDAHVARVVSADAA